jgi:tetratricopeptide (TPR) repeat protein
MACFVLGEYQKSIDDFTWALKLKPDNFRAFNNRGIAFRMLHQYAEALADFEHSLELNAYQTDGYYVRALTYFDLQDYTKALENCEKALNLKPDFEPALRLKNMIALKIFA